MDNNNQPRKLNNADKAKGITHIVFGLVYLLFSGIVVYWNRIGNINLEPMVAYGISFLMLAYGLFRIYRGYMRLSGKERGW